MRNIFLTLITSVFFPGNPGTAQDVRVKSDTTIEVIVLRKEVDSLRSQVNLNLDLIKYNLDKDSATEKAIKDTSK